MIDDAPITLDLLVNSLPLAAQGAGVEQIKSVYQFARDAHRGNKRESLELYIEHDLAVALIICKLGMDTSTISAGILHDVLLPHTGIREEAIQKQFGPEVASLVSALGKLAPYSDTHDRYKDDKALEAIRRAILTIIEGDTRVILIHLADRLQDLRKAGELPIEKQHQLALEARDIHAPLANRLGVWQLKWEMEDLAFRYLEPQQYRKIANQIDERRAERNRRIDHAAAVLQGKIREANIAAEVSGRPLS
jgi:GTP pyrophosphokinase